MNLPRSGRWRFLALRRRRPAVQTGLAFVLPGAALLTCEMLSSLLAPAFEPPFTAAVALAAWFGGLYCGLASAALSALAAAYFYIPPYYSISLGDVKGAAHLIAFTATNVLITLLINTLYRAQSDVREVESQLRTATDLIGFGVWRADSDGNIVELSDSFLSTFGTTMARSRGMGWAELIIPEERERIVSDWRRCVQNGDFWDSVYHMQARDGQVYAILSRGVAVYGHWQNRWIGIHLDVTEREKATEQRLAHERDLARFNAELDQFAYVAAHDLQEPLRMVASYVQLIGRRYKDKLDEDASTFIGYAVEGANRLQSLLQSLQMLSVIGKSPDRRKPTNLAEAVNRAEANLHQRLATSHAKITCGDLPNVVSDLFEMTQLFENLFDNAVKFAREGEPADINVNARKEGRTWHVVVRDNGIGIDPAYANRIFDLFQRLNPRDKYPGTGIGLTICKKIVEVHGGRIWAEQVDGHGTAIHFTLPV